MSLIPPRAVHGGTPMALSADFRETLEALAKGNVALGPFMDHDCTGASFQTSEHIEVLSDTIEGARARAMGQLAATMLLFMDWKPTEPLVGDQCPYCDESVAP